MTIDPAEVSREAMSPILLMERNLRVFPQRVGVIYRDERWTYARLGELRCPTTHVL